MENISVTWIFPSGLKMLGRSVLLVQPMGEIRFALLFPVIELLAVMATLLVMAAISGEKNGCWIMKLNLRMGCNPYFSFSSSEKNYK